MITKLHLPYLNQQINFNICADMMDFAKYHNPTVDLSCLRCADLEKLLTASYNKNRKADIMRIQKQNDIDNAKSKSFVI